MELKICVSLLGSTSLALNQNGTVYSEMRYKPFGETAWSSLTETPTQRRYTGQIQDFDMGNMQLYFYNARYYDPELARFTQADTIVPEPGVPQSLNRFSYVLNNPLKYTDPSGHYACSSHELDGEGIDYCFGVYIDPSFTQEEIDLIINTLTDYAELLGGEKAFFDNVILDKILLDRNRFDGAEYKDGVINMGANLLYPADQTFFWLFVVGTEPVFNITEEFAGLIPPVCSVSAAASFQFILAHEITHGLQAGVGEQITNSFYETFSFSRTDLVYLLYVIPMEVTNDFSTIPDNPITVRNRGRLGEYNEMMADAIASHLYAPGLGGADYKEWILSKMPLSLTVK